MLINSDRNVIGWRETFISKDEIVDVSVVEQPQQGYKS